MVTVANDSPRFTYSRTSLARASSCGAPCRQGSNSVEAEAARQIVRTRRAESPRRRAQTTRVRNAKNGGSRGALAGCAPWWRRRGRRRARTPENSCLQRGSASAAGVAWLHAPGAWRCTAAGHARAAHAPVPLGPRMRFRRGPGSTVTSVYVMKFAMRTWAAASRSARQHRTHAHGAVRLRASVPTRQLACTARAGVRAGRARVQRVLLMHASRGRHLEHGAARVVERQASALRVRLVVIRVRRHHFVVVLIRLRAGGALARRHGGGRTRRAAPPRKGPGGRPVVALGPLRARCAPLVRKSPVLRDALRSVWRALCPASYERRGCDTGATCEFRFQRAAGARHWRRRARFLVALDTPRGRNVARNATQRLHGRGAQRAA